MHKSNWPTHYPLEASSALISPSLKFACSTRTC